MNYQRIYDQLIERAKNRITQEPTERHHIVPDCFFIERKRKGTPGWLEGNPDEPSNLVDLTLREHFIAHQLLAKIHGGVMSFAALRMSCCHRYNSREYEWVRKRAGKATKALFTPEKIEVMNEKLKAQIECPFCGKVGGMTIMQRWHFNNCKLSPSYVKPPKMKRRQATEETLRLRLEGQRKTYDDPNYINPQKGRKQKKDHQCKHCGLIAGAGQITRWHNDNCKQKDVQTQKM